MIMVLYDPPIHPTKKTLHLHIQLQISSDLSEHNKIANTQDYNNNYNEGIDWSPPHITIVMLHLLIIDHKISGQNYVHKTNAPYKYLVHLMHLTILRGFLVSP